VARTHVLPPLVLHKILKFGSFVVLFDPLKIFVCSNALHNIYSQSKIFQLISYGEALEMHDALLPLPELESHMSVVETFTVITSHLIGRKVICFKKKIHF